MPAARQESWIKRAIRWAISPPVVPQGPRAVGVLPRQRPPVCLTFGHALIVNPWGEVLADAGTEPGIVMAKIDPAEVTRLVDEGWDAGVLLRALKASQIVDVARSGERMPQKASYFWPKAITGLVFRSLG